jgi:hypothetical protein
MVAFVDIDDAEGEDVLDLCEVACCCCSTELIYCGRVTAGHAIYTAITRGLWNTYTAITRGLWNTYTAITRGLWNT